MDYAPARPKCRLEPGKYAGVWVGKIILVAPAEFDELRAGKINELRHDIGSNIALAQNDRGVPSAMHDEDGSATWLRRRALPFNAACARLRGEQQQTKQNSSAEHRRKKVQKRDVVSSRT